MTTLTGNTHPLARAQYDQGAALPNLPMNRTMLVLKRSPEQEAALQDLLVQQQTTSSANFHKWLTPDQFGQQFGLADADIQSITSWLASFGFQSVKVSKGRNVIEFSGTASQVETALHTPIHQYVVNGESHWANANDPQIPSAFAPVISGIVSLHNFRAKPALVRSGRKATGTVTPGASPQVTFTGGSHGLVPGDFNTIYNVAPSMTGSGVTIGVIADSNINVQDVADFRGFFGLPANNPQVILNGPDPGDISGSLTEGEAVLDATWSGAVAPNATIDLVVSEDTNSVQGTDLSAVYIVDNNLADVMTESFSACETNFASNAAFYSGIAEQAAAQGITFLVASGDGGPDGCDDPSTVPATPAASVNILASNWFTVAVGGTEFNDTASPSTYWNATNGTNYASAKSYIPENVWNESCTVAQCGSTAAGLWSSGGGQSILFQRPPWQAGVAGIPSANSRFLPDVALSAAEHDGYVVCLDASCQGSSPSFFLFSGTSASAQSFGGIMALVVQKTGGRVGIANIALYKLAAMETLSSCNASSTTLPVSTCIFNDTTVGNTNIPGETGFTAATGYDQATGLGSVNVTNLVNKWSTAVVDGTTTTLSLNNGTAVNVTHGTAVPVGITVSPVAPATGTPTGDVSLIANSSVGQGVDGFTLSGGAVISAADSTVYLPGGTYQVKAHYEGDETFLGSDSAPVNVTVTAEGSQTSLGIVVSAPCTTATSVTYGSTYLLSVAVADLHSPATPCYPYEFGAPPTGGVSLTDTVNGATTPLDAGSFKLNSYGYFEDQPIQLPVGTHTIKAVYAGDNSFTGSNATTVVAVTQATTTTTVAANPTTAAVGQSVTLTATVATQSNATANASQEPTGTVQFFVNGTALGSPVRVSGSVNLGTFYAQATAAISPTTLASGLDNITAQYSGDSNYLGSSTTVSATVNVGGAGINVSTGCTASTISILNPGQSGSCLITVTGANGFSGSVTLTCGVSSAPPSASDSPSCSFGAPDSNFSAPGTINLTAGSETGSATLVVNTTAASNVLIRPSSRPHNPNWFLMGEVAAVIACMFLLGVAGRKRRGMVLLAMTLCAVILVGTSCSSGSGGGTVPTNPGTTIGAYTITVFATPSGGTTQTAPITINVQ